MTAHSTIGELGWIVFVEQPLEQARQPLIASITRTALLVLLGVAFAVGASLFLARRMVQPIRALQQGAAKIGAGELGHRIEVKTGDEVEVLADQFNRMTAALRESYATLEQRVQERTRELTEALAHRRPPATFCAPSPALPPICSPSSMPLRTTRSPCVMPPSAACCDGATRGSSSWPPAACRPRTSQS